jgi:hypothetical protein
MATFVHPGVFLRRTLFADAATCAVVGALMSVASAPLQRLTGLPAWLLVAAGLALLPYGALLAWTASRGTVPHAAVWAAICLNITWAADCALLPAFGFDPTLYGVAFLAAQVLTVSVFAALEFTGLRGASAKKSANAIAHGVEVGGKPFA